MLHLNTALNKKLMRAKSVFVVLDCHNLELDGFGQHFQATVHFPLARAVDKAQQHRTLVGKTLFMK